MSTSIRYICDRCGVEMRSNSYQVAFKDLNERSNRDLCKICADKLKDFLKGNNVKE